MSHERPPDRANHGGLAASAMSLQPGKSAAWRTVFTCLGLTAAVFAIYFQVLEFKFVNFDDDVHVTENVHVTTGLSASNLAWDFGIHGPSQWHPLAWVSHQLDCTLFQLNAGGHHATSVLLHLVAAMLLFSTFQRLFQSWGVAAFTAVAFAVHPLNVESVAWISERRNVLCAVFFFLTIWVYLGYVRYPSRWRYLLVCLGHAAALMSKPLAVTLPCVLLLLDLWPLDRRHSRRLIWEKVPLFALSGFASILTILCQHVVGTVATFDAISLPLRLMNAIAAYGWYLQKLIWPFGLGVFYPHPALVSSTPWADLALPTAISAIVLVVISILAVCYRRQFPWIWLGWLWYLGVMVPMIGIMQVGEQQQADRYAYLPVVGLFLILASAGSRIVHRWPQYKRVIRVSGCALLVCWGAAAYQQVSYWRNSVTLFSHAIDVTQRNHWAHNNLGYAFLMRGRTQDAISQFSLAIQAVPNYGLAHYNLGVALSDLGQQAAARGEFETAVRLAPSNAQAHQRLAAILIQSGELTEAIDHFRQATQLAPDDSQACFNLGLALARTKQLEEAATWLERTLQLQPNHSQAALTLAMALAELNRRPQAIDVLKKFLVANPDEPEVEKLLNDMQRMD